MVLGTYANLYAMEKSSNSKVSTPIKFSDQIDLIPPNSIDDTVPIKIDNLKPDNSVNLKGILFYFKKTCDDNIKYSHILINNFNIH